MDPEEVSGAKPFVEAPSAEPVPPIADPLATLDEGESTAPHGDPLAPELTAPAYAGPQESPVEPIVPEPLDDGAATPPHGDVLAAASAAPLTAEHSRASLDSNALSPGEAPVVEELAPADVASTPEAPSVIPRERSVPAFETAVSADPATGAPPAFISNEPAVAAADPMPEMSQEPRFEDAAPVAAVDAEEAAPVVIAPPTLVATAAPDEESAPGFEPTFSAAVPVEPSAISPIADGTTIATQALSENEPFVAHPAAAGVAAAPGSESLSFREAGSGEPVRPVDDLEAAALHHPAAAALDVPTAGAAAAPEERHEGSPNWMLAFICGWSGATSLYEAWLLSQTTGLRAETLGVAGYLLLGIGLVAFAIEALGWGRPRRSVAPVLFPTVLTLVGVVCLVLWDGPARPL